MAEYVRQVKEDGTVVLNVEGFEPGTKVFIHLEALPKRRSLSANRHYFGAVLRYLSDYTGETVEQLHELFKLRFNPKEIPDIQSGEMVTVGGSTREMGSGEFSAFVGKVMDVATELGVRLPTVDQYWSGLEK